jgi:tetratricopeptide (TPR) repeat protein
MLKIAFVLTLVVHFSFAQQKNEMQQALALEKEFKVEAALQKFEEIIGKDPRNAEALHHASRMLSTIGGRLKPGNRNAKLTYYEKAKAYAERSINGDPYVAEARLAYIISLGLMSEIAINPREKIKNAKIIRNQAELIIQLDSTFAEAYFVLGKWHYELAKLNWLEQLACKFLGGLPNDISMESSMKYYNQAIGLDPKSILYLYGLANLYHYQGHETLAEKTLQKALQLSVREPDDIQRRENCLTLLRRLKESS